MKPEKIVLDTNIWISYFIKNRHEELALLILDNSLTVYSSEELIKELTTVLKREKFSKYNLAPPEHHIAFHVNLVTVIKTKFLFSKSPDPKDNFLFDISIQSNATHLVTGDKPLLHLKKIDKVNIISLNTLKRLLKNHLD